MTPKPPGRRDFVLATRTALAAGAGAEARRREYREAGVEASWSGVASYGDTLDKGSISINQALLVGQGTIRTKTIGNIDRSLKADELAAVVRAVEPGMDEGAFGQRINTPAGCPT